MIDTPRPILLPWGETDRDLFHALGSDTETMRYIDPLCSREDDDAALDRQRGVFDTRGKCGWAVERRSDPLVLGRCGIKAIRPGLPIARAMGIGWRFAHEQQQQGYAFEAARTSLRHARTVLATDYVAAITVRANVPGWTPIEKLRMPPVPGGDFDHRFAADAGPLKRHVRYRIARPDGC